MSDPRTDRPEDGEREAAGEPPTSPPSFGGALRRLAREARDVAELGAREASQRARQAAEAARPEVERLAREARERAESARPHVERAARDAAQYARDHEDDIRRAAKRGAGIYARNATPRAFRPAIDALQTELRAEHPNVARPQPVDPTAERPDAGAPDTPDTPDR